MRLPKGNGETIRLARGASLSDFAEKIDANPAALVQALFNLGEMVTATQSVGDDTLELLGSEMNFKVQVVSPEDEDRELLQSFDLTYGEDEGDEDDLEFRPPVVTVMGHVDHGKTRLLDTIRNATVREGEAGGITQHIGAYQVEVDLDGNVRPITFIDTPGHEAFTAMRARGAKATDIAILVVAADDGVMPQTVEAINHAQAADVPIVVAVNKIDKEGADPAKIRAQLTEYNLVAEDYGGDTMFVDISAKQGTNIQALLEAVVLTADAALDLRANPDMEAQGVAIEAHLDRGRGPVATVLIQRGTLRVGDSVVAGDAYGRVRRMVDEHGDDVEEAAPCVSATRWWPATPMVASAAWSTSTATTSKRRCPHVRSRSSASRRCQVPVTTSWLSTKIASPVRSPTGAARASATRWPRAAASGSAWKTWIRH